MAPRRRTLRDRALDRHFRRFGFVVASAADADQVAAALEVFHRFPSGVTEGYYASIHSGRPDYKAKVDAELEAILWPGLDALLVDHRSLVAAFMVKMPTGPSVVPIHQDWNTMEETEVSAGITCWIPLTPVTEAEGRFRLLPGSHRHLQRLRGSPGFPAPYEEAGPRICDELMVSIDVKVGEVLIMDGRVLHSTEQNTSGRTRVAAYINALPVEARALHHFRAPDGSVESFWVDDEFFTSFSIGERPAGEPFSVRPPYEEPQLSFDEVRAWKGATRLGRRPQRVG